MTSAPARSPRCDKTDARFLLLGHIDRAAATFTDLLQQLVLADAVAGRLGRRSGGHRGSHTSCRRLQKIADFLVDA
jgi:hypothetical protein